MSKIQVPPSVSISDALSKLSREAERYKQQLEQEKEKLAELKDVISEFVSLQNSVVGVQVEMFKRFETVLINGQILHIDTFEAQVKGEIEAFETANSKKGKT